MNKSDLQSILELHQKAYAFLLSCEASGHAASQPFDESVVMAFRNSESSVAWITRRYAEIPIAHRPKLDDVAAFAQLLCSFFATSFFVSQSRDSERTRIHLRALRSRRLDGTRKRKGAKEKERQVANSLRRLALSSLAKETFSQASEEVFTQTLHDPDLEADLTLWTYAQQLMIRSQFASQGPAVHQLWLDLPEKTRRNLTADRIWAARDRLLDHLNSLTQSFHQ